MRLVWHIIWKDVRRLRWQLALWSVVILAQYAAWRTGGPMENAGGLRGGTTAMIVLWALHLVLGWLIVPLVLEDDPLNEERAAWRTRPIAGGRMLAAKVGGVLVMVCVWPSVLTVPWWLELGFGPREIAHLLTVNAVGMALFALLALMVAVVAGGFARFVAWSLVLLTGAGLGWIVLAAQIPVTGERALSAAVVLTRASLACGVAVATAAVVVPLQFLTRRTKLARGLVAAMALLVALIVQVWPWTAAEVEAMLGGRTLPVATAKIADGTLVLPADEQQQGTWVKVTTELEVKGLAAGDLPLWRRVDPQWRVGERRLTVAEPLHVAGRSTMQTVAANLARGQAVKRDMKDRASWDMSLPNRVGPELRSGGAAVSARYAAAVWRGEAGPVVPLRTGASAARGWEHLHVHTLGSGKNYGDGWDQRTVGWWQTGPLFDSAVMLEMWNADGVGGSRFRAAVLFKDGKAILDEWPRGDHRTHGAGFLRGRMPVGVISVAALESEFDQRWRGDWEGQAEGLPGEGASLASVTFQSAARLHVSLTETPFVPDFVVEGRMEQALRRAKAENKRVLVRVPAKDTDNVVGMPSWWDGPQVREILVANFVCVRPRGEEAARWRKKTDESGAVGLVVVSAEGEELDRLRDLGGEELRDALRANIDGKTYAAVLMQALAAKGGDDRNLRFQLHAALRARGELAGAFDAIMWMVDHAREAEVATEVLQVGWRLQRFVDSYAPARAVLLERRGQAIDALRRDGRDAGAARRLFVITLGLRRDEAIWRELPRLLPPECPARWDYLRYWVSGSVGQKRYREVTDALELEKFFAEGPAWIQAQLLARRSLAADGRPATAVEWQEQLVRTGAKCVEALAGAGQNDAALRVAVAAMRNGSWPGARQLLLDALTRGGANAATVQRFTETFYGR